MENAEGLKISKQADFTKFLMPFSLRRKKQAEPDEEIDQQQKYFKKWCQQQKIFFVQAFLYQAEQDELADEPQSKNGCHRNPGSL